jgi:hypothetical protein
MCCAHDVSHVGSRPLSLYYVHYAIERCCWCVLCSYIGIQAAELSFRRKQHPAEDSLTVTQTSYDVNLYRESNIHYKEIYSNSTKKGVFYFFVFYWFKIEFHLNFYTDIYSTVLSIFSNIILHVIVYIV